MNSNHSEPAPSFGQRLSSRWWTHRQKRVSRLWERLEGTPPPEDWIPTGTFVDTGLWWRQSRCWMTRHGEHLHVLATGPRPFHQKTPLASVERCGYNHVTGQLWFEPRTASPSTLTSLTLAPGIAWEFLPHLQPRKESHYA